MIGACSVGGAASAERLALHRAALATVTSVQPAQRVALASDLIHGATAVSGATGSELLAPGAVALAAVTLIKTTRGEAVGLRLSFRAAAVAGAAGTERLATGRSALSKPPWYSPPSAAQAGGGCWPAQLPSLRQQAPAASAADGSTTNNPRFASLMITVPLSKNG